MQSYLTAQISASAVRANLQALREQLQPTTQLCAVVKADCYGHGLKLLLDTISSQADILAVATPEEAIGLRTLGYRGPVLCFFSACGYSQGGELAEAEEELISAGVIQTVVDIEEVPTIAQFAHRLGAVAEVHVKIDTGMNRSGVTPASLPAVLERIGSDPNLKLSGIYTHFATADEADKTLARRQLELFLQAVRPSGVSTGVVLHAANSAATIGLPESHLDMVRPGIAIYGYQPSDQMHAGSRFGRPCGWWADYYRSKTFEPATVAAMGSRTPSPATAAWGACPSATATAICVAGRTVRWSESPAAMPRCAVGCRWTSS